ncbi:MAG: hypothetical protein JO060_01630, partial [Candidatus Eremiobacteraeota bacterium]|nr:hypothetical protein [Candidatus Eremiobacteraeota bacterium]
MRGLLLPLTQCFQGAKTLEPAHHQATAAILGADVCDECAGRHIVETKDVTKFDVGIAVVAIVVFWEHDLQDTRDEKQP